MSENVEEMTFHHWVDISHVFQLKCSVVSFPHRLGDALWWQRRGHRAVSKDARRSFKFPALNVKNEKARKERLRVVMGNTQQPPEEILHNMKFHLWLLCGLSHHMLRSLVGGLATSCWNYDISGGCPVFPSSSPSHTVEQHNFHRP